MIFTTYWFLAYGAVFFVLYAILRVSSLRTALLIGFCALFHLRFAGPAGVLPIIALAILTYGCGYTRSAKFCTAGAILCVFALAVYKYSEFLCVQCIGHLNPFLGKALFAVVNINGWLPEMPPLAISFFVFEFVHYLLEVRRGGEPIRNPFAFIQFAIFFPTLVAGPIKRYTQFLPALAEGKAKVNGKDFAQGLTQVAAGFFKKLLLADNFAAYTTANIANFAQMSLPERWFFLFSLAFRIYFDFSGYSDIAIGLARMMGVDLPANFNWPYIARNMQDFWQRWHISLSTWIRDYVYIPLGGSRHGTFGRITNGAIAFALCGLWHGASWHFLLWGLYHGFGLAVSTTYRQSLGGVGKTIGLFFDRFSLLSRLFTFLFVSFGWLLFFYPVNDAWSMTKLLFSTTQR